VLSRERLEFEGGVISALFQRRESALTRRWRSRHENGSHEASGGSDRGEAFRNWFDPVETDLRTKVRGLIKTMIEEELETVLSRPPYGRRPGLAAAGDAAAPVAGHRHGHRTRTLTGTFGKTGIAVPRARIYRTCLASPIRCSSGFAVGLWPGRSRV
jgi:hypothetical protein